MSLRVLGYVNGRRIVADDGPSRARVAGYGGSALGHAITVVLTEAQRKAVEGRRQEVASPAEPGLDVERLARALYLVKWDGYDALIDLADDPEEWFYPPLILARLISDQWDAALSEPKP